MYLVNPQLAATLQVRIDSESRAQQLRERLFGSRAELDARIDRALERITRLQLAGREADACREIRAVCSLMDWTIEAVTTLASRDS